MPRPAFTPLAADDPLLNFCSPKHIEVLTTLGSYKEAAHTLGLPIGTYKSRLNRAKKKLAILQEKAGTTPLSLRE